MNQREGVCAACIKDEWKRAPDDPPLFSDTNCLDPEPVPTHLPAVSRLTLPVCMFTSKSPACVATGLSVLVTLSACAESLKVWRQLPLLLRELVLNPAAAETDYIDLLAELNNSAFLTYLC